jgi:cephalosporin hydroxylase
VDRMISMIKRLGIPKVEKVKLNVKSIYQGHFSVTYRGVPAIRCPFDFVIYQMIISKIKPDLVIEIGTHAGGGALYLADLMNNIGHGLVHTIDIKNQADELVQKHPRIALFTEGWEKYEIKKATQFTSVLVIEDSTHIYEDTLGAINKFAPLVTLGSYLIVEDGIIDELGMRKEFHGGPLRAINEFLRTNLGFEIDRHWCNFFGKNVTFNVNGYLKKIR